jgi:hypothetical protein
VNGCCRAGSGFAKRADVDGTTLYAIKAWGHVVGRDECRGCVNKNLSGFSFLF